jgi:hypothetical protein
MVGRVATAFLRIRARVRGCSGKHRDTYPQEYPQPLLVCPGRRRLLGADAVLMCVLYALDSQTGGLDELRVMDALQVASSTINDAVAALETPSAVRIRSS